MRFFCLNVFGAISLFFLIKLSYFQEHIFLAFLFFIDFLTFMFVNDFGIVIEFFIQSGTPPLFPCDMWNISDFKNLF